jgi:hypothetical protein
MKIEIKNPVHPGFYESIICTYANGEENNELEYLAENNKELEEKIENNHCVIEYDYEKYNIETTSRINDYFFDLANMIVYDLFEISDLLKKKVDEKLISPRFYNFETDRAFITVEVDIKKYHSFINLVFKKYYDELDKMILNKHSSYDGFISFYSNDIEHWYNKRYELDYNELETVFQTLIDVSDIEENEIYEELFTISSDVFCEMKIWLECYANGKSEKIEV